MVKILKEKERKGKEEIYKELDKLDSMFIDINIRFRSLKDEFVLKRDQDLVEKLQKNAEWSANQTLLLKGRLKTYDLGSNLFMDREYLQFRYRRVSYKSGNLQYIPLRETNYSGKKFSKFMERELGAKAHVLTKENKIIISSILIPRNKKNLIIYD